MNKQNEVKKYWGCTRDRMELQDYHIRDVAQTKSYGSRSLEPSIVATHQGDQQIYDGSGQYRYLNRPLPQLAQTAHLLHPTIDSGNVFLTQKPMNPAWSYTRENIPNASSDPVSVANYYQLSTNYHVTENEKEAAVMLAQQQNRYLPVYNQPYIPGDSLPAIHHHNHPNHPWYTGGNPTKTSGNIENYTHLGFRGYTQPTAYSTMGTKCGYDRTPGGDLEKVPSNIPPREYFERLAENNGTKSDKSYYIWFVVVIMIIALVALGMVLFYGLTKHSKSLSASQPTVYAHIHPQFIPKGQFPGDV